MMTMAGFLKKSMPLASSSWAEFYSRGKKVKEPIHGKVTIEFDDEVEEIIGPVGAMISASKTAYSDAHPDNKVFFNACIFNKKGVQIWAGDLDLTLKKDKLAELADLVGEIWITPEFGYRFQGLKAGLKDEKRSEKLGIERRAVNIKRRKHRS
jgi:hypothetical protein